MKIKNKTEEKAKRNGCKFVKPLVMLLFVLALAPVSFAEVSPGGACNDADLKCTFGYNCVTNICQPNVFLNAAVIVILISIMLAAIVYALGQAFESNKLTSWSQNELYEIMGTVIIYILFISITVVLNNYLGPAFKQTSIAYPGELRNGTATIVPWTDLTTESTNYINSLKDYLKSSMRQLIWLGTLGGVISSLGLMFSVSIFTMYLNPFAIFVSVQSSLSLLMSGLAMSIIQLQIQIEIMKLSSYMFATLLPLGILFRSFSLTRSAGGALIAICVGFTIVLPIMYLFIEDVSTHYTNKYCKNATNLADELRVVQSGITALFGSPETLQKTIISQMAPDKMMGCMLFKSAIEAAMLPFVAYLFTLGIIKNIAETLGARIDLGAIVKFI